LAAVWRLRTRSLDLDRTLIMGVLNVTPDSFSDGGRFLDPDAAIAQGLGMAELGADLVDVGGESTRPGAAAVAAGEELRRVLPVVEALAAAGVVVSIDTSKPEVAEAALAAGAEVVNDVTGFTDPAMVKLAASSGSGVVVMHMQGTPRTMQIEPRYEDVVREIRDFLTDRARLLIESGVRREAVVIDPGIGFGKTVGHNLAILARLGELASTGFPVLVGTSRKSFIGAVTGTDDPVARDAATAVSVALAMERGAAVVRVHNVSVCREALLLSEAIVRESRG
jgi:dihydropteroate synthase